MEENTQARRWVLTINNPIETDEQMQEYLKGLEHFKYYMFQREKGEEKGTVHFQIYIVFIKAVINSALVAYNNRKHINITTPIQTAIYRNQMLSIDFILSLYALRLWSSRNFHTVPLIKSITRSENLPHFSSGS